MNLWGDDLYLNNTFLSVKEEFQKRYEISGDADEATSAILDQYIPSLAENIDEALVWFALADVQSEMGIMKLDLYDKALVWIDRYRCFLKEISKGETGRYLCEYTLDTLRRHIYDRVNFPVKHSKRSYKCKWEKGDVFAYILESEEAVRRGLAGRYFLIQKVDETTWYPSHIIPIVYVRITNDHILPKTAEEFNRLEYVQTSFLKFGERFYPMDGYRPQRDIEEKERITYKVDEYGYLPEYRVALITTFSRRIPSKLIYLGNFRNVLPPQNEFIPPSNVNIMAVDWARYGSTFETRILERYFIHNRRELEIYTEGLPEDNFHLIAQEILRNMRSGE